MRTSILLFLLLPLTNIAFAEPTVKPPLHETTPSTQTTKTAIKPVPLEVKRAQAKMYKQSGQTPTHHRDRIVVTKHRTAAPKAAPKKDKNVIYSAYRRHRHLAYATVYPGSLRWNVERIARRYGWGRVVWDLPEDYRWVGKTRVAGHGVTGIFEKLLKAYPVQAVFYQGNHVLVIIPRTLQ